MVLAHDTKETSSHAIHDINPRSAVLSLLCRDGITHIHDRLCRAEVALDADPDLAALILDGVLGELVAILAGPEANGSEALGEIERGAPLVAMRLRLALRAPSPRARLDHCRALCEILAPAESSVSLAEQHHMYRHAVGGRGYIHVSRRHLRAHSARPLRQAR